MRCYVFLSDKSLLTRLPNNINNCIYSILTQSITTHSSLADSAWFLDGRTSICYYLNSCYSGSWIKIYQIVLS